ncbi:hypothetical protein Tco_0313712 [Tanacetum coccineum]
MRTRSQARKRQQQQVQQTSVESSNLEKLDNPPIVTMADNSLLWPNCSSTHRGFMNSAAGGNFLDKLLENVYKSSRASLRTWFGHDSRQIEPTTACRPHFERYVTANDAVLRNMQNQGQNLQSQMANLTDMLSKFVTANTASTSGSGTLPGNTVTNPKEDLKGITTRSGVTIQGPKTVSHDTEVTKDTMPPANNGSTEDVQPPVVQIQSGNPNPEPNVSPVETPIPKASIPFPSRRNDERRDARKS